MKIHVIAMLALASTILLTSTAPAQEEAGQRKGKGQNRRTGGQMLIQKLEAAELTAEQQTKLKEAAATMQKELKTLREAGLTPEMTKKKASIIAEQRKEKKGRKAINDAMTAAFQPEQLELLEKAGKVNTTFRKTVFGMLTDEQVEKLPEALQKQIATTKNQKAAGGKGKGAGKKKQAAEAAN